MWRMVEYHTRRGNNKINILSPNDILTFETFIQLLKSGENLCNSGVQLTCCGPFRHNALLYILEFNFLIQF